MNNWVDWHENWYRYQIRHGDYDYRHGLIYWRILINYSLKLQYRERLGRLTWKLAQVPKKVQRLRLSTLINILTHSSLIIHEKWQYHERLGRLTWKLVQVPKKVYRLRLSSLINILTYSSSIIHDKWQQHQRLRRLAWKLVQVPNKVHRLRLSTFFILYIDAFWLEKLGDSIELW